MVPLEARDARDAPERKLARSALLPVVLSGISAFDLLLVGSSGSATPAGSLSTMQQLAKLRNDLLTFQGAVLVH